MTDFRNPPHNYRVTQVTFRQDRWVVLVEKCDHCGNEERDFRTFNEIGLTIEH